MDIYGVYDLKQKEQCILVGNLLDVKKYFGITARKLNNILKKHEIYKDRYELVYCYEEGEKK